MFFNVFLRDVCVHVYVCGCVTVVSVCVHVCIYMVVCEVSLRIRAYAVCQVRPIATGPPGSTHCNCRA